ncbi:MAG: PAS domain S-box protein [Verrucomicrobiia bacterium]
MNPPPSEPSQTRLLELSRLVTRALGQLDSASFAILDPRGFFAQVSPGLLHLLQAEGQAQVIGADLARFVASEHHPTLTRRLEGLRQGQPVKAEFEIIGLRGRRLWCQAHSVPLQDARGRHNGEVMVLIDIDRRYSTAIRFDRFYSSTAVGIYQMDANGRFISANPAFLRLVGFDSFDAFAAQIDEAHLYCDPAARRATEAEIRTSGQPHEGEFEVRCRDGRHIWLAEDIHPVTDTAGNFLYFEGLARDVTAKRVAEADLELLHAAVANVEEGLLIVDHGKPIRSSRILFANDPLAALLGYPPEELTGQTLDTLFGPQTDAATLDRLERDLTARKSSSSQLIIHRRDGGALPVLLRILPALNDTGRLTHWLVYCRDMSAQVETQIELQQDRQLRALGEMATGLAHEWNNLLSPILMELGRLEDLCEAKPDFLPHVRAIRQAAEQAATLAEQVLSVSRKEPEKREPICINDIIRQATFLVEKAVDRRIEIQLDLEPNLPAINLSSSLLLQVILNLAFNARDTLAEKLQTNTEQGWRPVLTLESRAIDLAVPAHGRRSDVDPIPCQRLTIADNGMGMSDKTRSRLFEAYFTTKKNHQSVGLGTAMVWGIVQSLGGWIEVDTQVGSGSCFHIYLPALETTILPAVPPRNRAGTDTPAPESLALTILLVDDYHLVAKTFSEMLRRQGHTLFVAHNGREALGVLQEEGPRIDLLITDLNMPTMSGPELLRLCDSTGFRGRKLVMTGFLTEDVRKELETLGVDGILQKPFKPAELIARVRQLGTVPAA